MRGVEGSSDTPKRIKAAEYMRRWRAKHPECAKATVKRWIAANPKRYRGHQRFSRQKRRVKIKDTIRAAQGKGCPICLRRRVDLVVDHDHSTNQIRGLLCGDCNSGLGFFRDNIQSLKNAATYLTQSTTYGEYFAR